MNAGATPRLQERLRARAAIENQRIRLCDELIGHLDAIDRIVERPDAPRNYEAVLADVAHALPKAYRVAEKLRGLGQ